MIQVTTPDRKELLTQSTLDALMELTYEYCEIKRAPSIAKIKLYWHCRINTMWRLFYNPASCRQFASHDGRAVILAADSFTCIKNHTVAGVYNTRTGYFYDIYNSDDKVRYYEQNGVPAETPSDKHNWVDDTVNEYLDAVSHLITCVAQFNNLYNECGLYAARPTSGNREYNIK